uniref:Uncharacterized protein n=1 Tax=Rhizophora mucronata TaxID=61149 RepID=A0A2P2QY34_RHIMU
MKGMFSFFFLSTIVLDILLMCCALLIPCWSWHIFNFGFREVSVVYLILSSYGGHNFSGSFLIVYCLCQLQIFGFLLLLFL